MLSNMRIGRRHVLGGEMNAGAAHIIQRWRIADYMVRSHLRRFAEERPHERRRIDTDGRVDRLTRASRAPSDARQAPSGEIPVGAYPCAVDRPEITPPPQRAAKHL